MNKLKDQVKAALRDNRLSMDEKRRLMKVDLENIEKALLDTALNETEENIEEIRRRQMDEFGRVVRE